MKQRIKAIVIAFIVFVVVINLAGRLIKAPVISNLNNGKVELIGHAGSGFNYLINPWNPLPANSLASILKAFENGAEGIEVDVQVSKDSALILYHDLELETQTDLSGAISKYNSDELLNQNYKLGFPYDYFQNEKIISLRNLISAIENIKYKLYLDIKTDKDLIFVQEDYDLIVAPLKRFALNKKLNPSEVTIISSDTTLLAQLMNEKLSFSYSLDWGNDSIDYLAAAKHLGCKSLCINNRKVTKELIASVHSQGLQVIVVGGKSVLGIRKVLEMNPDVMQVNNVRGLKKLLN